MLQKNVTYSLGGLALIELAEKYFSVFSEIFGNIHAESMDFQKIGELLVYNRLTHSVSIHQIMNTYPTEVFRDLGFKHIPSERSIYRALEKVGRLFPVLLERYQLFLKKYDLADNKQFIDFSSSYFEGTQSELGAYGYSKDKRADKMQVEFGISTGLNEIPTALTIQKGNMNDKKHMNEILNIVPRVIPKNSMLIFDTGGNTKKNKNKIREMGYHYLTLKPKKISPYKKELAYFKKQYDAKNVEIIKIDDNVYYCAKMKVENEIHYIYFSNDLYRIQIHEKNKKFKKQIEKGNKILSRRKRDLYPSEEGWVELVPELQKTLEEIENPYFTGLEGFFILESSVDEDSEHILKLYKDRDKAEKFIRAIKEGLELRPIRHWNQNSIKGLFFIIFLTEFIINLTRFIRAGDGKNNIDSTNKYEISDKNIPQENVNKFDSNQKEMGADLVKNIKLLKKHLISLTKTIIYPEAGLKFHIISNITPQITHIFGDFIKKYEDKTLILRW